MVNKIPFIYRDYIQAVLKAMTFAAVKATRRARCLSPAVVGLVSVVLLASCAIQLAPDYDKSLLDGLAAVDESITSFVAGVPAEGYSPATYDTQAKFYSDAIGKTQALEVRMAARPVPKPLIAKWLGIGEKPQDARAVGAGIPSVASLKRIEDSLTQLRDRHKAQGFSRQYAIDKGEQIQILFVNATTYENALKR